MIIRGEPGSTKVNATARYIILKKMALSNQRKNGGK